MTAMRMAHSNQEAWNRASPQVVPLTPVLTAKDSRSNFLPPHSGNRFSTPSAENSGVRRDGRREHRQGYEESPRDGLQDFNESSYSSQQKQGSKFASLTVSPSYIYPSQSPSPGVSLQTTILPAIAIPDSSSGGASMTHGLTVQVSSWSN